MKKFDSIVRKLKFYKSFNCFVQIKHWKLLLKLRCITMTKDEVNVDVKSCHIKFKIIEKIFIAIYAFLRFLQAFSYILLQERFFSPSSALAVIVAICSILLLTGAVWESEVLLEIWMVWTVLKFGAMIFSVFNLEFENHTFLSKTLVINVTVSSCEYSWKKFNSALKFSSTAVLKLFTFILVLMLYKSINKDEIELSDYPSDFESKISYETNILTAYNIMASDAVAFEPSLFTTNMMHYWIMST